MRILGVGCLIKEQQLPCFRHGISNLCLLLGDGELRPAGPLRIMAARCRVHPQFFPRTPQRVTEKSVLEIDSVRSIITMTKLENIDPALTNREDHNIFIDEARPPISEWRSCVSPSRRVRHLSTMSTAWPRMCMNASVVAYACCNHLQSEDDATDDRGLARPNIMTAGYISADVGDPLSPQGGRTAGATFHITQAIVTVIFTSRFRSCWHL